MKFSNKLSFTIFITGLIALLLLSFAIYKFNHDSLIAEQAILTESMAIEIADDVNYMLSEKTKTTLTLANSNTIIQALEESIASYANLSDEKRKESINQLNEKWKSTKDPDDNFILKFTDNKTAQFLKRQQTLIKDEYGEIFLTNKFGALVASTSKLSTFAHGHKYWWKGAYNNGKGAVFFDDRGYDDSVGGYVLGLVVPVKKGNEIIGILKCNLNILGSITELITGEGNNLLGNSKMTRSGGRVVIEEGYDPLSTQIDLNIIQKLKNNDQGTIIVNDSKEKYLVGFSQIKLTKGESGHSFGGTFESIDHKKGNKGESWYVLFYRQMSIAQAPIIESIRSILLTGFTIIIVLLLVSYLFGKKIAHPLAMLNKATQKIGKGSFEYRIDISQKDEFGNLASSFNQMADKLQHTTTTIELFEKELAERKQAEKALRESEKIIQQSLNRFKTIFEEAPLGVALIDSLNGHFYELNTKFAKIAGRSREEMITTDWMEITHPDDVQEDLDNMAKLNAGEITGFQMEKRYLKTDGTVVWINMTIASILGHEKTSPRHLCMVEDITERKQIEGQLRQIQKLESIGTLAGGIAHDFNNLLYVVMGNISLALDDIELDIETSENLKEAEKACIRAKELSAQLITFSKGGEPVKKKMPINSLLKDTVFSMLRGSNITPKISIAEDIRQVNIDESQIKQVFRNIVVNAKEAMDDNGQLTVSCENVDRTENGYPAEYIKISFKDQGCGILKENLEKIFDPYFSTKDMGTDKGQGLGLAVCYSIIKKHGGLIHIDSEPQTGSNVSVYLPAISFKNPEL